MGNDCFAQVAVFQKQSVFCWHAMLHLRGINSCKWWDRHGMYGYIRLVQAHHFFLIILPVMEINTDSLDRLRILKSWGWYCWFRTPATWIPRFSLSSHRISSVKLNVTSTYVNRAEVFFPGEYAICSLLASDVFFPFKGSSGWNFHQLIIQPGSFKFYCRNEG